MKTIPLLSDSELLETTERLAVQERKLTLEILHHLNEIDRRRLYCSLGFGSLYEYAVKKLKYSEGSAARRISAMRLLRKVPGKEKSLASGSLNLTQLSQAAQFVRQENYTAPQAEALLDSLEGKSTRECERKSAELSPKPLKPEKKRMMNAEWTEIRFNAHRDLLEKLQHLKDLLAHQLPDSSYAALFEKMADLVLKEVDPLQMQVRARKASTSTPAPGSGLKTTASQQQAQTSPSAPAPELKKAQSPEMSEQPPLPITTPAPESALKTGGPQHPEQSSKSPSTSPSPTFLPAPSTVAAAKKPQRTRYIPAATRREAWKRYQGKCQRCGTRHRLQIDHIRPVAHLGTSELENLRLLCFPCNQWAALQKIGPRGSLRQ